MVAFECVFDEFGFVGDPLPVPLRFGMPGVCLGFLSEGLGVSVWRTKSCFSKVCAERRETQIKRTAVSPMILALRLCDESNSLCV